MNKTITATELKARLEQGDDVTLVEALPLQYYRSGHLPGALHLPLDQLEQRAPTLLPERTAEIVVYCASSDCEKAEFAARKLTHFGYTNVVVFPGGKAEWKNLGLPLRTETIEPPPRACCCH